MKKAMRTVLVLALLAGAHPAWAQAREDTLEEGDVHRVWRKSS